MPNNVQLARDKLAESWRIFAASAAERIARDDAEYRVAEAARREARKSNCNQSVPGEDLDPL